MKKTTFPIVKVKDNKLFSLDGNTASFYELLPPDGEQLSLSERESFFKGVASSLNNLDETSYFKFYQLGNRSFLETNAPSPRIEGVEFVPNSEHLPLFFGDIEIFSDIGLYDDYLLFNGQYLKILSVMGFSEQAIGEDFLPLDVDYALFAKKIPPEESLKRLDRIRSSHMVSFSKGKRDFQGEGAYTQAEDLMEDLANGVERLFSIELFFILRSSSLENLNKKVRELQISLMGKNVKLFLEGNAPLKGKTGLVSIFNELIPGVRPKLSLRSHLDKSSHLLHLLPLRRSHLMETGIPLEDQREKTIYLNPFQEGLKNKNMLVTGMSGTGKSVFVNKVLHHLIPKHPMVILDKGGSFQRLTLYHGGRHLGKGFNPMQFQGPLYLREMILSVVDGREFNKMKRGQLLKSIKENLPCPSFQELLRRLEKDFPQISLYFEDIKDFFTEDTLEGVPVLYIDVENFPQNILSPLMIFVLEYFKNIKEREKILVFDECWRFLKNHSDYIDECFRTFRKSGSFPIAISQGISDFEKSDLYHSIGNNSYFKVFFPQETSSKELSSFDRENIKSLDFSKGVFSDCYLKSEDNHYRKILRIHLSPLEWELFQTEAGNNSLLEFYRDYGHLFPTGKEAIHSFIRMKYDTDSFLHRIP